MQDLKRAILERVPISKSGKGVDAVHQVQPCRIRRCTRVVLRDDSMTILPNTSNNTGENQDMRMFLCELLGTAEERRLLRTMYKRLNLCEAPVNFVTHQDRMTPTGKSSKLYSLIADYLHIVYGDVVMPAWYYLHIEGNEEGKERLLHVSGHTDLSIVGRLDGNAMSGLDYLVNFLRNAANTNVLLTFVSVPSRFKNTNGHAMLLAIWKDKDRIKASVMCPMTRNQDSYYVRTITDHMRRLSKSLDIDVIDYAIPEILRGQIQMIESQAPKASIDAEGYCGAWTLLLMEIVARNVAAGKAFAKSPFDLLTTDIILPSKHVDPRIWRKLVIDYLFSRTVDAYAISRILRKSKTGNVVSEYMKAFILDRYVQKIRVDQAFFSIAAYVPRFWEKSITNMARYADPPLSIDRKRKAPP